MSAPDREAISAIFPLRGGGRPHMPHFHGEALAHSAARRGHKAAVLREDSISQTDVSPAEFTSQ